MVTIPKNYSLRVIESMMEENLIQFLFEDSEFSHLLHEWLETDSSPTSSTIALTQRERKPRWKRPLSNNPAYHPTLRILKRDVRRKYGDMLNNVFNSHDLKLILEFFQTFATRDFLHTLNAETAQNSIFSNAYASGIDNMMKLTAVHAYMLPDLTFQMYSAQVIKRSDQAGSKVVAKVTMRGTHLFVPLADSIEQLTNEEGLIMKHMFRQVSDPDEILREGICVLLLDENHRMKSFQVIIDLFLVQQSPFILG